MGDISVSTNDDYAYTGIKIIFNLISVFLLFPLMWSGELIIIGHYLYFYLEKR